MRATHLLALTFLLGCGSSGSSDAVIDDGAATAGDSAIGADASTGSDAAAGDDAATGRDAASSDTRGPPAVGTPGKWENVTPKEMPASLFVAPSGFGAGNIVQDPRRPTDMFVGGYGSIWRSTDYGLHWSEVKSSPVPPYGPLGHVLAIADDGGTTATLWVANPTGGPKVYR